MTRPWTLEGLAAVHVLARAGTDLDVIADAVGRFRTDVDLALWALVGRSPGQALARLQGRPLFDVPPTMGGIGQFLRETHP